jgi:hypothetical protein
VSFEFDAIVSPARKKQKKEKTTSCGVSNHLETAQEHSAENSPNH